MIIDFRLRPPFGDYVNLGMYKNKARCASYAANIGAGLAPSIEQESMELTLKEMDENGIDIGLATGRAAHFAGGMDNDVVIDLVTRYPRRFLGMAGLDPRDWRGCIKELHRTVVDGPLKGVVLEPGAVRPAMYGNDPHLYPVYAECEKYGIPVMIMLGGNAGPDVSYSFPQIIHQLAADFPGINFIISHGGWPWVQAVLGVCFFQQNIYLSPDLYLFNQPGWQDYVTAVNTYMQDRFLYASAYPFMPLSAVATFKKMFPKPLLDKLLYQNAAKVLKLEPYSGGSGDDC
ncbi:amidohydrolase family protein [uncultured Bilophila sp.]|uniref:amidohydrolase family protein n=1 Tax=uncultured Bilophila sp. TaxID=529385 RepID=UPI00280BEB0E|nr:amidohydrolase family protein [uncultured Bilophila sp.]